jgi:hypothetical protein
MGKLIDEMLAGAELDALVAEKVMGWRWVKARPVEWFTTGFGRNSCAANRLRQDIAWMVSPERLGEEGFCGFYEIVERPEQTILNTSYNSLPGEARWGYPSPFSTSIESAWGVAEQMGMWVGPHVKGNGNQEGWEAGVGWEDGGPWAHAKTAPLAICRAALKA